VELRYLRYFVAVAEQGSFTRAAAHCFVAQSALSQQIARLEKETGSPLFSRSSRSVRLTAAGEVLLPLARRILADVDHAQAALDALGGLRKGRLRLGLVQTTLHDLDIVEVLADYHARYPGIDLHVTNAPSDVMAQSVLDGDLDVAVVGLGPRRLPEALRNRPLGSDPLVAVVPREHPLAGREIISLAELSEEFPLIQFLKGSGLRRQVEAAFGRASVQAGQRFEIGRITDMIRLAVLGVGVTVVPRSAVSGGLANGARVVGLDDDEAQHALYVVYDEERLAPAAAALLELLTQHGAT